MLTVTYVYSRRDPFHRPRCALAQCRSAFCPHYKAYQIYRFSLSPPCSDASIHFRADTQKPASILSRTLTAGAVHITRRSISIQCQQPIIQQRETRRSRNSVYLTDRRNSTKPSTTTEITKWQKYSQNTTTFICYEWVDHTAVYNYMFRPLSAIVRLYYFPL